VPQVACFDTAFHRGHAFVHDTFALPREYFDAGVRRYGFHGLSYEYIAARLRDIDPAAAGARVVVAHLGSGASLCAIRDGRSVASSMGFTALDGLPMGTRPGHIDPGVLLWLMAERGMDAAALTELLYRRSGLKGLSGLSGDLRDLHASGQPDAAQAVDYFVAQLCQQIAAMTAALGGLDALIFTAGIGENDPLVRARAMAGLRFLGIEPDPVANERHGAGQEGLISGSGSAVRAGDPTDEERMIARTSAR
jgi:acetate kinase